MTLYDRLDRILAGYESLSRHICRPSRSLGHYVARRRVVERILGLVARGLVPVVYGPRGAGKTTLLRCLALVLPKLGVRVVYVGLHLRPPLILGEPPPRFQQMAESLVELNGSARGSRIAQLARMLGRGGILIVDDFDIGLNEVEVALLVRAVYENGSMDSERASIILASSEARLALSLPSILVGNIVPAVMWHMMREEHAMLAKLLGYQGDVEKLYEYTGGSPDALVAIREHGWSIEEWLEYRVKPRVEMALAELRELGVYLDSLEPDRVGERRSTRHVLLRLNLLSLVTGYPLNDIEKRDWIGRRWAWQLPAYPRLLKQMLEAASL